MEEGCHLAAGHIVIGAVPVIYGWIAPAGDPGGCQLGNVILEYRAVIVAESCVIPGRQIEGPDKESRHLTSGDRVAGTEPIVVRRITPAGNAGGGEFVDGGRAEVGAHLHPWVTPPAEEEVTRFNSYAGNLPLSLESSKIARLVEAIEASFGRRPIVYKAGRYGFGANTASISWKPKRSGTIPI